MSKALGAAFLNHQVEQLEKSVSHGATGNWRDRKQAQSDYNNSGRRGVITQTTRRQAPPPVSPGIKIITKKKGGGVESVETPRSEPRLNRSSIEESRAERDVDVVVVDASVLVHALYQVKNWSKEGRQEKIIIPLEGALVVLLFDLTPNLLLLDY